MGLRPRGDQTRGCPGGLATDLRAFEDRHGNRLTRELPGDGSAYDTAANYDDFFHINSRKSGLVWRADEGADKPRVGRLTQFALFFALDNPRWINALAIVFDQYDAAVGGQVRAMPTADRVCPYGEHYTAVADDHYL